MSDTTFPTRLVFYQSSLPTLRQKMLCHGFGVERPDTDELLDGGQCLFVWCYELLHRQPWLSADAVAHLTRVAEQDLRFHGNALQFLFDELSKGRQHCPIPTVTLAFAEGRFVTWTSHCNWLDIREGDILTELPVTPMESIAYNLTELFRRGRARCEHLLCQLAP